VKLGMLGMYLSLKTGASKIRRYEIHLVGYVVRWDKGHDELADNYRFLYGNGNDNHHLGSGFFVCKGIR